MFYCNCRHQPFYRKETRKRAGRIGLQPYTTAAGQKPHLVQKSFMDSRYSACDYPGFKHYLLLN
jgi:hypothetical protein